MAELQLQLPGRALARPGALALLKLGELAPVIGLLVALGMGAFLRVVQINELGYNSDEAVYAGQAASIAGDPARMEFFQIFRAHPLLFQSILSLGFLAGAGEIFGRLASAAVGVGTIYLTYRLGQLLYGRKAALLAALFIALMPYHVVITRQVLLDGPMTFSTTLSLYFLARFVVSGRSVWLYATGAAMGLALLSKEPSILFLGAAFAFFSLSTQVQVRFRDLGLSLAVMALIIAPFPISVFITGNTGTGENFVIWQLFRRPNHEWDFYATTVPQVLGPLIIATAALGLWLLRRERSWKETLLLSWIVVPLIFFQLWPVKGYQYLLPVAPPIAVLAGRTLGRWPSDLAISVSRIRLKGSWLVPLATGILALTLLFPTWQRVQPTQSQSYLAGSGGVPGGREAGEWIKSNVPEGAQLMTIGPSMANILQFYGHRKAYGLAVSPNPLHRNPAYEPIINPDLLLRTNEIQYVVWDSFSAARSSFFSEKLLRYADRYHGRIAHTETVRVPTQDGKEADRPVIVIYEVRP